MTDNRRPKTTSTIHCAPVARQRHARAATKRRSTASNLPTWQLSDFVAYMPMHNYAFLPTRDTWPASSVNARLPSVAKNVSASEWLDANAPVEQMTWLPGARKCSSGTG